jgi:hypothetical protein
MPETPDGDDPDPDDSQDPTQGGMTAEKAAALIPKRIA